MRLTFVPPDQFPRCQVCGKSFKRRAPHESREKWMARKNCSRPCAEIAAARKRNDEAKGVSNG